MSKNSRGITPFPAQGKNGGAVKMDLLDDRKKEQAG
jgi:hypothetical protein